MREILFRGKSTETKEWAYGCFLQTPLEDVTLIADAVNKCHHHIDPETVGQYTGLNDKNGKKIFEGDKISVDINSVRFVGSSMDSKLTVGFFKGVFCGYEQKGDSVNARPLNMIDEIEIIGNIHEANK